MATVTRLSKDILPRKFSTDPKNDLQILAPLHRVHGSQPNDQRGTPLIRTVLPKHGATFQGGDKVIQTRNNYDKDVFNGDMGTIEAGTH